MQEKNQTQQDHNLVAQYRAEVTLGTTRISLTGPSIGEIQQNIQLLAGRTTIQFIPQEHTHLIYKADELVGWVAQCGVPASFSFEHQRKAVERAAA